MNLYIARKNNCPFFKHIKECIKKEIENLKADVEIVHHKEVTVYNNSLFEKADFHLFLLPYSANGNYIILGKGLFEQIVRSKQLNKPSLYIAPYRTAAGILKFYILKDIEISRTSSDSYLHWGRVDTWDSKLLIYTQDEMEAGLFSHPLMYNIDLMIPIKKEDKSKPEDKKGRPVNDESIQIKRFNLGIIKYARKRISKIT